MAAKAIFICYAHKDRAHHDRLRVFLKPFERAGSVDAWSDQRIKTGQNWKQEIDDALDRADIAILLVSPDFQASDFIQSDELPAILRAQKDGGLTVLPVVVGHCFLRPDEPLMEFQAVNSPHVPLVAMRAGDRDRVWKALAERIDELPGRMERTTLPGRRAFEGSTADAAIVADPPRAPSALDTRLRWRRQDACREAAQVSLAALRQQEPKDTVDAIVAQHLVAAPQFRLDEWREDEVPAWEDGGLGLPARRVIVPIGGDAGLLEGEYECPATRGGLTIESSTLYLRYELARVQVAELAKAVQDDLLVLEEWNRYIAATLERFALDLREQVAEIVTERREAALCGDAQMAKLRRSRQPKPTPNPTTAHGQEDLTEGAVRVLIAMAHSGRERLTLNELAEVLQERDICIEAYLDELVGPYLGYQASFDARFPKEYWLLPAARGYLRVHCLI